MKQMAEHLHHSISFIDEFTEKDMKELAVELIEMFT